MAALCGGRAASFAKQELGRETKIQIGILMRTLIFVFLDAVGLCMYFFIEISLVNLVIIKCHCNNYEIIDNDVDVD